MPLRRLPLQPTPLVGRDDDIHSAARLLRSDEVRLLTIGGPAGAGKTRLAIAVAAALADVFPGGTWFVDLSPIRAPGQVLPEIARAFGMREQRGESVRARLERQIRDRQLLLVLDNFEQVLEAATDLAELLSACPRLKVLATSRAALRLRWEQVLPVAPLAVPNLDPLPAPETLAEVPSVALFVQRAQAVQPAFRLAPDNARVIAELCVRLDGLPLAIELAAAGIDVHPPRAMLDRLQRRLDALGDGAPDLPARQRTLAAAFDWTYDRLAAADAALFRRLAVFLGGITAEAAARVAGSDALETLVRHNLIWRDPDADDPAEPRWRMLETVRTYALERLTESGERDAIGRAHATYMLDLAEQAAPALLGAQQALWLGRLERDRDNLAEALRWTLQHSEIDLSLRFARSLWRFWWLHGHLSEGMAWLEQVLAVAAGLDSDDRLPLQAAVLNGAGVLAHVLGAYERATLLLGESLDLWRRLGSEVGEAAALHNLAALAREQGDWQRAAQAYTESLELERRVGNRWGIATSLTNLGALAHDQGDDEQAARLHTEALELMRELGDNRGIASALHNLADVARDKGDWQRAALLHEESLGLWRQLGDRWSIGVSSLALGRVRQHLGDARTAARLLDESLAVFDALGVRQGSAACLEGLAEATLASGRAVDAARLLGAAEALRETIGAPLAPRDRPGHARLVDALRRSVAPAAWRAAWRAGRSLTLGDVTLDAHRLASTMDAAPPPAGPSDVLTPRQRDVAALIVRGLTNRQIAAQLVISERTADRHVSNILDKLGLSTRAQVAAWVARDRPNHP